MRDIRISLDHDTLEYGVEEVKGGHLKIYTSTEKNHDAVLYAKMEIVNSIKAVPYDWR